MDVKAKKLLRLIKENPKLPIIPIVYYEGFSDESCYLAGSFGECAVEDYAIYKNRFYTDKDEFEDVYYSYNSYLFEGLHDDEVEKLLEKETGHLWIKAIVIYIELPD